MSQREHEIDVSQWPELSRPCVLCGHPMGKHVVPAAGTRQDEVGSMGLLCPPNVETAKASPP